MRGISIGPAILTGLALTLTALPAWAQTQQQYDLCYSNTATPDQTIDGCTALIESGRYAGPDLSHVYNNRSTGYSDKKQYDLAIQDQTRAIQLDPTNASAYYNRAGDYHNKGEDAKALPDADRSIALAPTANHFQIRGEIYEKLGQRDQAIADYRAALRLDPNRKSSLAGLQRLGVTP